ncbi:MAG: CrcB family protein [Acidimicrobiales bacterium]
MDSRTAAAVALGGVAGAGLRWGLLEAIDTGAGWPWATFLANILGSVALGLLVGRFRSLLHTGVLVGATTGFCGALTTFSAFAVELAAFMRSDRWTLLIAYLVLSVLAGGLSFLFGRGVGQRTLAAGTRS